MDAGPEDRNSKRESQPETWVRLPWGQGFNSLANKVASARRCLDEADATRTVLCLAEWNVSLLLVNRRSSVDGERMLEDAVCAGMKIIEEKKEDEGNRVGNGLPPPPPPTISAMDGMSPQTSCRAREHHCIRTKKIGKGNGVWREMMREAKE